MKRPLTLKEQVDLKLGWLTEEFQRVLDDCWTKKMNRAEANKLAHEQTAQLRYFVHNCPSTRLFLHEKYGKK